jgi:hypothetical protein
MRFCTIVPIKTAPGLNVREHYFARSRRVKKERDLGAWVTPAGFPLPCVVTLTRLSAGELDSHDNLSGSMKGIVDGIADKLGIKDNDGRVQWRYEQERCARGKFGVRIELEAA